HLSSSIHLHVRQLHPFPTRRSSDLRYHSDEPFEFLPQHLAELEALPLTGPKYPQRYYLLACTGDEVLDWRTMANWYQGSQGRIIEGGDHSISNFERYIPEILEFALPPLHSFDAGHS